MQFVVLKEYLDPKYFKERKVMEAINLDHCIRKCLEGIDLSQTLIATYKTTKQIRIPKNVFVELRSEVQKALRDISEKPEPTEDADARWVKENYWAYCKAYIFNFSNVIEVSIGVTWGYEGEEGNEYDFAILEMKHPFVAEFLGCSEGRWGEFAEKENIKKWLKP